jgi:hypothetical protein
MRYPKARVIHGLILISVFLLIIGACVAPPQDQPLIYPTPTTSLKFAPPGGQNMLRIDDGPVSGLYPEPGDLFGEARSPGSRGSFEEPDNEFVSNPRAALEFNLNYVAIYADEIDPNWMVHTTEGSDVNFASKEQSYEGELSLTFTPGEEESTLYFAIKENAERKYNRDEVFGLSFWLYSGDLGVATDEVAVTVLGSNAYSYWVAGDNSVKSPYVPVFSETRLYYLGVNRAIPPQSWVKVELWMDDRIYDPDYLYVTGFYVKTSDTLQHTISIDDIQLILIDYESPKEEEGDQTGEEAGGIETGNLQPVWTVTVDALRDVHPISPYIYGVSVADVDVLESLRPTVNSWGGNPSTRFNWEIGHAWNAGRDYFFKNGNYGITSGSASDGFIEAALGFGLDVRLAVPTLGWVAKNDDLNTCSFPLPNGECDDVPLAKCETPTKIADPTLANVPSDTESIRRWMEHLFIDQGYDLRFVAMDNEPELWGYTHYDVHPECTTYQEILEKYLAYATVVREVAPEAELMGPVTCCWYFYWNSAAGFLDKLANGNEHFLPWFLTKVREHDEQKGIKTIDILDIHYYQEGVYHQEVDEATAAHRLRSTRSLWDRNYADESWINEPIYLIPRMKEMTDEYYPGLKLGITEWNWGADLHINGALAIADVLGIFGREDLYFASYWTHPPIDFPGFFAFRMYTNYDGLGSRFGDTSVWAETTNADVLSSFAALDSSTGKLHLMLINKQPDQDLTTQVYLKGFSAGRSAERYQYSEARPNNITKSTLNIPSENFEMTLPAYSITLLVIDPAPRASLP